MRKVLHPASWKLKPNVLWYIHILGYPVHLFLGCCTVYKAENASIGKWFILFHVY